MIGILEIAVIASVLLAVPVWCAVVSIAPKGIGSAAVSPRRRMFSARAWLYAPIWLPALVVSAALLPGILGILTNGEDNCLRNAAAHVHHLCLLHAQHVGGHGASWLLPFALIGLALAVVGINARNACRESQLARTLVATSSESKLGDDVRILDQREPIAMAVGLFRMTILVSSGLVDRVSRRSLSVVLAHEREHVRRRDTLFALLDRFAASLLPLQVARPLMSEIALGREQLCDEAAAGETDAITVARALTEVLRLGMQPPQSALSVASASIEARIVHLLNPPQKSGRWVLRPLLFAALLIVSGVGPLHGVVEHLIDAILH